MRKEKNMPTIEIYFDDLTEEKQKEILDNLGDNGNYDLFPLASLEYEESETQELQLGGLE